MARQRTNKTTIKRFKVTNPKDSSTSKLLFKQSHQNHLRTKKSKRAKRRQSTHAVVAQVSKKSIYRKAVNL